MATALATRLKSFVANGRSGYALADQAVQSATSFVTGIIVARACTPAEFGVYILGLRLLDIAMEIENVTIWAPLTVLLPRQKEGQGAYIRSTVVHQLVVTAVLAIAMFIGGTVIVNRGGTQGLGRVVLMLSAMFLPILAREYARRVGFARLDLKSVLRMDALVAVVQLSTLWLFSRTATVRPELVYAVIGVAAAIGVLMWGSRVKEWVTPERHTLRADWLRNWKLGKWFVGGNLTLLASTQVYPWSLSAWHGPQATAMLGAGDGVVNLVRAVLMAAQNLIGPLTAHAYATGDLHQVRRLVWRVTMWLGLGTALFCIGIFFAGEQFATLLYGNKFAGLGPLLFLMSLNMLCMALTLGPSYALSAMDRPDVNVYINGVVLLVSCTAGLILVRSYGTIGAALGLVAANAIATVLRHIVFVALLRKKSHDMMPSVLAVPQGNAT